MRHEPLEFGLATDTRSQQDRGRRPRAAEPAAAHEAREPLPLSPAVLDEAFALLESEPQDSSRADARDSAVAHAVSPGAPQAEKATSAQLSTVEQRTRQQQKLVASLAAQLVELDRQREQLSQLLRGIKTDEPAAPTAR